jgi:cardiolipin synthase
MSLALRLCLWLPVVLSAGCHAPPARPADDDSILPRNVVLARQLLADSAFEVAHHPLRCCWEQACESADFVRTAGRDVAGSRLALCFAGKPGPLADRAALAASKKKGLTEEDLQPAHIQLHVAGQDALDGLDRVIDQATHSIDVLMFIWESDDIGMAVARRIAAKASDALSVRVLVDGGGNLIFSEPEHAPPAEVNRAVRWLAEQPHVEVIRTRNPFGRFDHRKLVLADGRFAWTGGRNLTKKAFCTEHDLSFTLAGPLVAQLQQCFNLFWAEQGGRRGEETPPEIAPGPGPIDDGVLTTETQTWVLESLHLVNARIHVVGSEPTQPRLARALYRSVDESRHHIYMENPYFSDARLIAKLILARRRGVDVRVVITLQSDSDLINHANRAVANRLLESGIRVYLYPGMTHVKATVVDSCWAYMGTGNFDPQSLRRNREVGVVVAAGPVVTELEETLFLADFRQEWELREPLRLGPKDHACELLASLFL